MSGKKVGVLGRASQARDFTPAHPKPQLAKISPTVCQQSPQTHPLRGESSKTL